MTRKKSISLWCVRATRRESEYMCEYMLCALVIWEHDKRIHGAFHFFFFFLFSTFVQFVSSGLIASSYTYKFVNVFLWCLFVFVFYFISFVHFHVLLELPLAFDAISLVVPCTCSSIVLFVLYFSVSGRLQSKECCQILVSIFSALISHSIIFDAVLCALYRFVIHSFFASLSLISICFVTCEWLCYVRIYLDSFDAWIWLIHL